MTRLTFDKCYVIIPCPGVSNDNSAIVEYDHVVAAVKEGKPLVLDVRTREEHSEGFIPGAVNVPLAKVKQPKIKY